MGNSNVTSEYEPYEFLSTLPALSVVLIVVIVIASLVGTFGNVLILVAVATQRDLKTIESIFVVNLACCDLYVTLVADPLSIVGKTLGWRFFADNPGLCRAVGSLCTVSCVGSLMTLSAMSCNRYVFVCHQRYYGTLFTARNSVLMCLAFYLVGFCLVLLNFFGVGDHSFDHKSLECIWDRMANHDYTIVFAVVMVLIPIVVTGLAYVKLYLFVRQSKMKVHSHGKTASLAKEVSLNLASMLPQAPPPPPVTNGVKRENSSKVFIRPESHSTQSSKQSHNNLDNASGDNFRGNCDGNVAVISGYKNDGRAIDDQSNAFCSENDDTKVNGHISFYPGLTELEDPTTPAVDTGSSPTHYKTQTQSAQLASSPIDYKPHTQTGKSTTNGDGNSTITNSNTKTTQQQKHRTDDDASDGVSQTASLKAQTQQRRSQQDVDDDHHVSMADSHGAERSGTALGQGGGRGCRSSSRRRVGRGKKDATVALARTLFLIYLVFSACWLPFSLLLAFDADDTFSHELHVVVVVWAHLHPSLNWIIYYYSHTKFHNAFTKLLRLGRCR